MTEPVKAADEFIFGVYDSQNKLIGYKVDAGWDLTPERGAAKSYPLTEQYKIRENLLFLLNDGFMPGGMPREVPFKRGNFDEERTLHIIPENVRTGERTAETMIKKRDRYYIV